MNSKSLCTADGGPCGFPISARVESLIPINEFEGRDTPARVVPELRCEFHMMPKVVDVRDPGICEDDECDFCSDRPHHVLCHHCGTTIEKGRDSRLGIAAGSEAVMNDSRKGIFVHGGYTYRCMNYDEHPGLEAIPNLKAKWV